MEICSVRGRERARYGDRAAGNDHGRAVHGAVSGGRGRRVVEIKLQTAMFNLRLPLRLLYEHLP
jgi:hypothetical protein